MSGNAKIAVNGAGSGTSPDLQDQITLALLQNGGVGRIQTALQQRLDEAGWSENLRDYVTRLFRSGECTTFFEAMDKVKRRVGVEGVEEENGKRSAVNGDSDALDLTIPRSAAEGGVEAVRKELEGVCEMKK